MRGDQDPTGSPSFLSHALQVQDWWNRVAGRVAAAGSSVSTFPGQGGKPEVPASSPPVGSLPTGIPRGPDPADGPEGPSVGAPAVSSDSSRGAVELPPGPLSQPPSPPVPKASTAGGLFGWNWDVSSSLPLPFLQWSTPAQQQLQGPVQHPLNPQAGGSGQQQQQQQQPSTSDTSAAAGADDGGELAGGDNQGAGRKPSDKAPLSPQGRVEAPPPASIIVPRPEDN